MKNKLYSKCASALLVASMMAPQMLTVVHANDTTNDSETKAVLIASPLNELTKKQSTLKVTSSLPGALTENEGIPMKAIDVNNLESLEVDEYNRVEMLIKIDLTDTEEKGKIKMLVDFSDFKAGGASAFTIDGTVLNLETNLENQTLLITGDNTEVLNPVELRISVDRDSLNLEDNEWDSLDNKYVHSQLFVDDEYKGSQILAGVYGVTNYNEPQVDEIDLAEMHTHLFNNFDRFNLSEVNEDVEDEEVVDEDTNTDEDTDDSIDETPTDDSEDLPNDNDVEDTNKDVEDVPDFTIDNPDYEYPEKPLDEVFVNNENNLNEETLTNNENKITIQKRETKVMINEGSNFYVSIGSSTNFEGQLTEDVRINSIEGRKVYMLKGGSNSLYYYNPDQLTSNHSLDEILVLDVADAESMGAMAGDSSSLSSLTGAIRGHYTVKAEYPDGTVSSIEVIVGDVDISTTGGNTESYNDVQTNVNPTSYGIYASSLAGISGILGVLGFKRKKAK